MKIPHVTLSFILGTVAFIGVLFGAYTFTKPKAEEVKVVFADVRSMPYTIDGKVFLLENGIATLPISPTSASVQTVRMFSQPVYGDLNGDGDAQDAAVLLVSDTGGSGSFFYAFLAIKKDGAYTATNALYLGDRIAPQTIEIRDGRAVYNYAERKADEPMTAHPSQGKSLWVHYNKADGTIGEFVQDFTGEADPKRMSLTMTTWKWVKTEYTNQADVVPQQENAFTLTFSSDGKVSIGTDCNRGSGTYTIQGNTITFGSNFAVTKMYCEGSQEQVFFDTLQKTSSFMFTSRGELRLNIKDQVGVMVFR